MTEQPAAPAPESDQGPAAQSDDADNGRPDDPMPSESAVEETVDDLEQDAQQFQQYGQNINNFFGSLDARGSMIGVGGSISTSTRRSTGNISVTEVSARLACFVEPPPFDDAVRTLSRRNIVGLCGPGGIGKPTSALGVASAVVGRQQPITRLPPSYSLADLVDYPNFKSGRAYLIQDWIVEHVASALQKFEVDVLERKLRLAGAYLVITTGMGAASHRSLAGLMVRWSPPDPVKVFEALLPTLDVTLAEDKRAETAERIVGLSRPADVIAVTSRLSKGVGVAFEVLGDVDRDRVTEWFAGQPDGRSLLSVAAVCFLNDTPESVFQQHLSRLVQIAEHRNGVTTASAVPVRSAEEGLPAFPQRAALTDHSLDEVARDSHNGDVGAGDRHRRFRSPRYAELAIAELADRYGFELWDPLRQWIDELAAQEPSLIQVRLALGMALYARHSPNDVQCSFLDRWADGMLSERLTAAYLLSWMCIDAGLAATALRASVSWATNAGQRRASTAAMAFGGELGIRFPSEALRWLWYLAMRAESVSRVARSSLGQLCCAAVDDPESVATVLLYLRAALRRLIDDGEGRPEQGRFNVHLRKATSTVFDVLTARPVGTVECITALILRTRPDNAQCLGELWAEVLCSWPHRAKAIDELISMIDVMRSDDNAVRVMGDFGAAAQTRMTDEEIRLLLNAIHQRLSGSGADAKSLASALLTALKRRSN